MYRTIQESHRRIAQTESIRGRPLIGSSGMAHCSNTWRDGR